MSVIAMLLAAATAAPARSGDIRRLVAAIDRVERSMPLTEAAVTRVFGPPAPCRALPENPSIRACDKRPARFGAIVVGDVDFRLRHGGPGFVLVLHDMTGDCVTVALLARRYGADRIASSCTDGVICNAAYVTRRWGTLYLSLPNPPDLQACATQITFNSAKPFERR